MTDPAVPELPPSRRLLRRGNTARTLIEAAFKLLDRNKSFDALSQRELTREVGIVPTAFYRHFPGMEALGLALVEDSFRALREILDDMRKDVRSTDSLISTMVKSLVRNVREHRQRFRFIAAERHGGNAGVREAIRRELRLFQSELATDLARLPYLKDWSTPDLHMLASLMVNAMVAIVEEILDRGRSDKNAERELTELAEKQLRLIVLGVPHWRSGR
ncbi:MAG: TetR family transcriptional regulator [Gammaproteobacteria bacterium]|nr:TetR family transcriptional regulator [Gammaproteobacteria bacterium]